MRLRKPAKKHVGSDVEAKVDDCQPLFDEFRTEVAKILTGQKELVESLLEALLCDGHVLLEGIPGIGKTLAIRAMSRVTGADFGRIQFTPDLLPTDIVGVKTYQEGKGFYTMKGPVFTNFLIADEINRSPPKVQSALLEAMQERQVTIGSDTYDLHEPFFVMATQNPLEQHGTYNLPEAQLDRFLYKCIVSYPSKEEETEILERNMTVHSFDDYDLQTVFDTEKILDLQELVKKIGMSEKVKQYIIRLTDATRHPEEHGLATAKFVNYGASPRASIGMYIASKARALLNGRSHTTQQDVRDVAPKVLRHRVDLNFEAQAENIEATDVIDDAIANVNVIE